MYEVGLRQSLLECAVERAKEEGAHHTNGVHRQLPATDSNITMQLVSSQVPQTFCLTSML
jgi:hypothetical protein